MELLFAFTFVCNLQFKSCNYRMNPQPFRDPATCTQQLIKDVAEAEAHRPDSLGDAIFPRYMIFGQCRPPAFKFRIQVNDS